MGISRRTVGSVVMISVTAGDQQRSVVTQGRLVTQDTLLAYSPLI